jgi:hypothetical protein
MTEYEIADLALSTQEVIQQQVGLVLETASLALTSLSVYFTLIFGYLIVAYFIGASLTRVQNAILTLLYVSIVILNRIAFLGIQQAGKVLHLGLMELSPDATQAALFTDSGIVISTVVFAASIIASLYFMWRVRHPKAE